jgi:type IV pilus assembly protein PilA
MFNKKAQFFLFQLISYQRISAGFTLLELLIVVFLLGLLSAVSIPTFIGQIGKARESEILLNLGGIARAQQNRHFAKGTFAQTMTEVVAETGLSINTKYYSFLEPTADVSKVKHQVEALPGQNDVRNYAIGVYFDAGSYTRSTCQGLKPGDPVNVGDLAIDDCSDNGTKIY